MKAVFAFITERWLSLDRGGVDATTLDGYYVMTLQVGGKPVNQQTDAA